MRAPALVLALALLAAPPLRAQPTPGGVTLSGRVQAARDRSPMAYLTVQLRRARDSAFVAGRLTDATGAFSFTGLARGTYLLEARVIGLLPLRERVLVGELSPFLDLGVLLMQDAPRTLERVVVAAGAEPVEETMQQRTVTVADNVSQAGGSVLQALSTVPGVTVGQDGTVLLRGSDKVAVLIDGKQTALTGLGTQRGLDNLPASAIARIEVITAPSARHDANASAGIINLVLRTQDQRGFSGRAGFTGGAGALWEKRANLPTIRPQARATPKLNPTVALNWRTGGTNVLVQGDWLHAPTLNKNEFATRTYDDGTVIVQQVKRNRRTDYATLRTGLDHAVGPRTTLAVSALANREKILDDGDNPYFSGTPQARTRLWQFREDEVKYTAWGTAVLAHRFPQPGHTLTGTGTYSFHREDERYDFTDVRPAATGRDAFKLLSDEHVVDLLLDYVRPLRQGRLEAGARGRLRTIPVDMRFFPGPASPLDTGAGGWATYRERIPALYGTYVYEGPRVELEGGLRLEAVRVDYEVTPGHNTYASDGYRYGQPFPTLRAALRLGERDKVTLLLNRRVDRPNEVDIRIFPKYDEPELVKVGNPALRPQFTTAAELGYKATRAPGSLYAAVFHRVVDGTITRIATQGPASTLLFHVFQNAGRSWSTGAEVAWQQVVSPRLSLGANASAYRNTIDAFAGVSRYPVPTAYAIPRQRLVSGTLKGNAALALPHGWDAQLAGTYLAPDLIPQGRIGTRASLDLGARKRVQGGRGEFVVNATDVLNTMQLRRTIRGTGFRLESTDYLETQVIRVGYVRKF